MSEIKFSQRVSNSQPSATVAIADLVKQLREAGKSVYDFSAGRAFEPTPVYVSDAAIDAINSGDTHQTMARGTTAFRKACADKLSRENSIAADPEKEIIATMGAKQGLTIALLAILNPGDEVLVEDPCFVSYRQTINYLGGKVVPVPLLKANGFRWTSDQLRDAITSNTKAIIICSPQNPTGVVHTRDDLQEIAQVAISNDLVVITDEVYERTAWGTNEHLNIATLPEMRERTATIMSLTKSFSMGGWRIGFIYAPEKMILQLEKLQQHLITCPNSFVQAGAEQALGSKPKTEVLAYWREWEKKVRYFNEALMAMEGVECQVPEGGFYAWADISSYGLSSEDFTSRLLQNHHVAVVPGSAFGENGEGYIRITCVKTWQEIEAGLSGIKDFLSTIN